MTPNRFDLRLKSMPDAWAQAAVDVIDTADAVLLQLEHWVEKGQIPCYDSDLHGALTRLIVERHNALTTPIQYPQALSSTEF
jgi:hypothetical protein